jgi:citrate synthase
LIETPTFPGIDAATSAADPEARLLAYRGYPVQELCRRCSFEEVAYLLWHGELPTHDQIYAQNHAERAQRALDPQVAAALAGQPSTAHPMDTLELAVGMLGAADAVEQHEVTPSATRADALRLYAALPTIVALDQRRRHGLGAVAPRADLSYAANFLYMTFGKVPEPQVVAAFEKSLILHACRRSSARLTTPPPDLHGAVAAAIRSLKLSPDGGAAEAVLEMINLIAIPDNARPWVEEALVNGRSITGFGLSGDVRVPPMRAGLAMIAGLRGGQHLIEIYDALADAMYQATGLLPTLDYPTGPAYQLIGFDTLTFTPILAVAQFPGWTAHITVALQGGQQAD